jgi:hypothetical protein
VSNVDDLVTFLNARLDEAEKRARRGYYSDTHWEMFTTEAHLHAWQAWRQQFPREQWDVKANDAISEAARDGIRARITAHEADRTAQALRDIEADRALIAQYVEVADNDVDDVEYAHGWANALGLSLRCRALRFADHEDYQEGWRP